MGPACSVTAKVTSPFLHDRYEANDAGALSDSTVMFKPNQSMFHVVLLERQLEVGSSGVFKVMKVKKKKKKLNLWRLQSTT